MWTRAHMCHERFGPTNVLSFLLVLGASIHPGTRDARGIIIRSCLPIGRPMWLSTPGKKLPHRMLRRPSRHNLVSRSQEILQNPAATIKVKANVEQQRQLRAPPRGRAHSGTGSRKGMVYYGITRSYHTMYGIPHGMVWYGMTIILYRTS